MVFYICMGLTALVLLFVWFVIWTDEFEEWLLKLWYSFLFTLAAAAIAGVVTVILIGISYSTSDNSEWVLKSEEETSLVALKTADNTSGEFHGGLFASYGYIEGQRVINYISKDEGGGIRTDYATADSSIIYETDDSPRMVAQVFHRGNYWVLPWNVMNGYTNLFYVPPGSVVEGYEITV